MTGKQRKNLVRILISFAAVVILAFVPLEGVPRLVAYLAVYLVIGYDILMGALHGIINRQPLDESLLMTIATIGAFALAIYENSGDYNEAIAVMLFYQVGEWFQSYAVGRSRRSISSLMEMEPDHANLILEDGSIEEVDCEEVEVGSIIAVKPGERIPIDGIICEGASSLNTSDLTGESMPRDVGVGDEVVSGCINIDGALKLKTSKEYADSTVARILELIEESGHRKARSEKFISRFARIYTPAVVGAACAMGIGLPVVKMLAGLDGLWGVWLYRALTFLVISCPCALVVSIPLSFFAGIGGAGRKGILIKGSSYMENLSDARTIVFDKTGTLTRGKFKVAEICPAGMEKEKLLHCIALAELYSAHPIAESVKNEHGKAIDPSEVIDTKEIAGEGIIAGTAFGSVAVGNEKLMKRVGAVFEEVKAPGTVLYAAIDGVYAGYIVITDSLKDNSKSAIAQLKRIGIKETIMLTGDNPEAAAAASKELGIDRVYSRLLPADKVSKIEEIMAKRSSEKERVVFVGDGINDAPVLIRSDVGIAMGALGSAAAIEAADVVLMNDDPADIVTAIRLSAKCMRIVKENIWFAITIKIGCLVLSAFGLANMWLAIFADVGVLVLAILNAMRCFNIRN